MIVSIIVAKATNNAIGINGELPWRLPSDLNHFKRTTSGHHVIMGRKTFVSLGKPLPGRTHIVVTRNPDFKVPAGHFVANNLEEALSRAKSEGIDRVFILGGAEIYKDALPLADEMIITEIEANPAADTFFPTYDPDKWEVMEKTRVEKSDQNPYTHTFVTYRKK
ncbi:dihydrofolate reductase [Cyclobacterium xiamenense]|uniref:Dihydrofolate reductase n=1 Tax=Cyclobacterium xiamenense TaxID=1297121 RepID=A0A1H6YYV3_9BACT|nr:dihydrofolate reductase [Cyclobacterium xiamenense]SEJ46391.1 dihydrofolate reductase [Cyclobacterium xiamenense]